MRTQALVLGTLIAISALDAAASTPAVARRTYDRLSEQIMNKPERSAAKLISKSPDLFPDAWLWPSGAYFLTKPAPHGDYPDVCEQQGLVLVLNGMRDTVERVRPVQRYAMFGPKAESHGARQASTCAQVGTFWAGYAWAPSALVYVRALDLFAVAISEAGADQPKIELLCSGARPCTPERRAELARMKISWVVDIAIPKCPDQTECYAVEVWDGDARERDQWTVTLYAKTALTRARLSNLGKVIDFDH